MFFKKNSKEDEEISKIIHRHPLIYLPQMLVVAVLLAASLFFLFYFSDAGIWQGIAFGVPFFAGLVYGARALVVSRLSGLMITDQRLVAIQRKGFFSRNVSEIALDKIQDVSYQIKGILQTIFNYGTISVQTGGETEAKFKKIPHPKSVQESIIFFQSQFKQQLKKDFPASVAIPVEKIPAKSLTAEEVLERLSPEELAKLLEIVSKVKNSEPSRR